MASSNPQINSLESSYPPDRIDRALIQQIASARDHQALETLYLSYRSRLAGFLRRMTRDDDLIEDVYNDVMLKVWNKAHQYQGQSKVSSWIFSIAYRVCLRMIKKQKLRQDVKDMLGRWTGSSEPVTQDPIDENDLISRAINALSGNHRMVVELCYFSGYSTDEISEISGCPVNTVKTRLFYARKKIRAFIEDHECTTAKLEEAL